MSKTKKTPEKATKRTHRWSLGVFQSAANGDPIVTYCRVDGTVVPYMQKKVKTTKARVHATYTGVTYAEARARLMKESGLKEKAPAPRKAVTKGGKKPPAVKASPTREEIRKAA